MGVLRKQDGVEHRCEACDGTGLQPVKQPDERGRRIYPPPPQGMPRKGSTEEGPTDALPPAALPKPETLFLGRNAGGSKVLL
jgi:hypothetical protein